MAYSKKTWVDEEVITSTALNNMETGIDTANKGIPSNATKAKAGLVKMAATVAEVSAANAGTIGGTFNQAEVQKIVDLANANKTAINAIIKALKEAGIISNS